MFSFLRRPKQVADQVKAQQSSTNVLSFDPSGIVRAIAFHLLDEGKAHAISPESSEAAVQKLSQRINRLTISADQWAAMENVQRLNWLLNRSHIVVRSASSGAAMLSVRRWPVLYGNR